MLKYIVKMRGTMKHGTLSLKILGAHLSVWKLLLNGLIKP